MGRKKTRVADTQLAFDLWGLGEEANEHNGAAAADADELAGNHELPDPGRSDQQRSDGAQGSRSEGPNVDQLVGSAEHHDRGPAREADSVEHRSVPRATGSEDRSALPDPGVSGRPHGAAGDVRAGRGELRQPGGGSELPVDGGGRRAAMEFSRAGVEAHQLGDGDRSQDHGVDPRTVVDASDDRVPTVPVLGSGGNLSRVGGGVAAVATVQRILRDGRHASDLEVEELRRFPGWGATPELFDPTHAKYAAEREQLQELWSPEEWAAARRTVLNAHYTHPEYVRAMWGAVERLGVPSGAAVLEPGCGTGNFIEQARPGDQVVGIELDPTTASIAQLIHTDAEIRNESFTDTRLEGDGFDLAIGNVPFGDITPYDPVYNQASLTLHNAFIVKSLRLTKPGGIVAVMTSRWTMDGRAERSRREISKYGELLGAVRMPAGAHGEVAGTEVIIDVLVFRRHLGGAPAEDPRWVHALELDNAPGVHLNSYFDDHPDHVLGQIGSRSGKFGPELTVRAEDSSAAAIAPLLDAALHQVVDVALERGISWAAAGQVVTDRPVAAVLQDPTKVIGRVDVDASGMLTQLGLDGPELVKVPKNAVAEVRHLLQLRDVAVELLEAEAATGDDTSEISDLRSSLNWNYDAYVERYGPLGRFTTTVRERAGNDPIITRRFPAALRALRSDPHFPTLVALEHFNEDTGVARKATIFQERVVGVTPTVARVDTPADAIAVSLDRVGRVDVALVAELLDIEEAKVPDTLADLVYLSPADLETYIPAAEYLSGNVRQKRALVRELALGDVRFQRHLDDLNSVVPEEFGPAEIDVKFGASWVPVDLVGEYIQHALGKQVKAIERIDGEWRFQLVGRARDTAESRWSVTGDRVNESAEAVFKRVLNGDRLELRYRPDRDAAPVVDQIGTEALQERASELHEHFQDWLWSDADRAIRMQDRYNDLYNGIVLRSYDGVQLTFPGKAATFEPRPHQHALVARMLAEPAVGAFHEVGAGKTAEMVLGVMELRRLGMAQKPAIVVPNQMLEQFTREFKQICPRARVLSAGSDDIASVGSRDGRKMFVARARSGDWDAVILTHGAFSRIGLGASQADYARERLDEMQDLLTTKLDSELSGKSVKRLEKELASAEERLKKLLDIPHDEGVSWEETGIDYLCVDEAHLFKNLTVLSKVDDLAKPVGSQRAQDLDMKLWYHRDHLEQSRVVTLATATPLPNSIIEMYVMQRYLRPDLLRAAEVYSADDWARQFTEQVAAVEAKPDGGGFQVKTRTTKFRNLPELLRMWHVAGDVKTQADLKLPVPQLALNSAGERAPEMVIVPATRAQQAGMADLIERGELVRDRKVAPEEDNMLKITANGRALALDARLLGEPGPEDDEVTKLDVVARNIHQIWNDTKDYEYLDEWGEPAELRGAFQIVFSDLGTPGARDDFSAYTYLREELVRLGMPRDGLRFIHEAKNDAKKAELFQACRDGRVQVLFGSTEKMGVGTNVQTRAIALHHVDAPWRPADVTQREGREIRQGNQNAEAMIFRYATEGSFDAYMWGTLARKAQFIEQVLTGRLDVREVDNSSEMALQFAEMQAITIGDMRILEVADLRQETQKLGRQERAHARKIGAIQARRFVAEGTFRSYEHDVEALRELAPHIVPTKGDAFAGRARPRAWAESPVLRDRTDFGRGLRQFVMQARERISYFGAHHARFPAPLHVEVHVGGIDWDSQLKWNAADASDPMVEFHAGKTHEALFFQMRYSRIVDGDLASMSRLFEQYAADLPNQLEKLTVRLEEVRTEISLMRELESEVWPKKDELEQKRSRLASLIGELEREAAPQGEPPAAAAPAEPAAGPAIGR